MPHASFRYRSLRVTWHARAFLQIPRRNLLTLAIETSCDDTCVAILSKDKKLQPSTALLFDRKITAKNTGHGGIHPIEALDSHIANLSKLINQSLTSLPEADAKTCDQMKLYTQDGNVRQKPNFVAVTRGPGMRSNLMVGLETAKGLATAWQVPLVGVHHMQAHTLTPRMIQAMDGRETTFAKEHEPEFPFLTLLVSGGHTMLLLSKGLTEHTVIATTSDTAIGDALDKCGRLILPEDIKANMKDNAFGKYLSPFAFKDPEEFTLWPIAHHRRDEIDKRLNKFGWQIGTPLAETRELSFSFSSIATSTQRIVRERNTEKPMETDERTTLARTALGSAFEHLGSRTIIALEKLRSEGVYPSTLVVSGGVAANDFLRFYLRQLLNARSFKHVDLIFPPIQYCTDNAAMIAWAGMEMFEAGYRTDMGVQSIRKWSMDARSADGGILGVGGWLRV